MKLSSSSFPQNYVPQYTLSRIVQSWQSRFVKLRLCHSKETVTSPTHFPDVIKSFSTKEIHPCPTIIRLFLTVTCIKKTVSWHTKHVKIKTALFFKEKAKEVKDFLLILRFYFSSSRAFVFLNNPKMYIHSYQFPQSHVDPSCQVTMSSLFVHIITDIIHLSPQEVLFCPHIVTS